MTTKEKEAIQYMVWRHTSNLADLAGLTDGFQLHGQKAKWTPGRLYVLWKKYLKENNL